MEFIVDISKPPIGPPNRTIRKGLFVNKETKESIERTRLWLEYMLQYRKALKNR